MSTPSLAFDNSFSDDSKKSTAILKPVTILETTREADDERSFTICVTVKSISEAKEVADAATHVLQRNSKKQFVVLPGQLPLL